LYLTTSLALLSAFYISLYLLPLLLLRRFRPAPSLPDDADPESHSRGTRRGWRVGIKVFAYRISMLAVFVLWLLVLGVAGRCTALALTVRSGMGLSGAEGVGGGTIGKCELFGSISHIVLDAQNHNTQTQPWYCTELAAAVQKLGSPSTDCLSG
jgi:hypothetical protein